MERIDPAAPDEVNALTTRPLLPALIGTVLVGCASVPAPATRSPQNPAHPAAPEAATPPATPVLTGAAEEEPVAQPGSRPAPEMEMHKGHGTGAPAPSTSPASDQYTCPMHPQVRSDKPGMTLINKDKTRPQGDGPR